MEEQKQTSFMFEIDNFSEKEGFIRSPKFLSEGCEWYVKVYPKGDYIDDHLSLYLFVADRESLRLGWKRRASYSIVLLNQSGKELFRSYELCSLFCAQFPGGGLARVVPLKRVQEKGFLENNKLIVKVEVKVVEAVDEGLVTGKEMYDIKGFQVLYSQAVSVGRLFTKHPDIAVNFRLKNPLVKTTYMNLLLGLIKTLNKPPHSLTESELINAQSELIELTEAGFKLDWLKTKLDKVSLEWKQENADGTRVQELEEHIKNLKAELDKEKVVSAAHVSSLVQALSKLMVALNKEKVKSAALEQTVSNLKDDLNKKAFTEWEFCE